MLGDESLIVAQTLWYFPLFKHWDIFYEVRDSNGQSFMLLLAKKQLTVAMNKILDVSPRAPHNIVRYSKTAFARIMKDGITELLWNNMTEYHQDILQNWKEKPDNFWGTQDVS